MKAIVKEVKRTKAFQILANGFNTQVLSLVLIAWLVCLVQENLSASAAGPVGGVSQGGGGVLASSESQEFGILSLAKLSQNKKNEIIPNLSFFAPDKIPMTPDTAPLGQRAHKIATIHGTYQRKMGESLDSPDLPKALVWKSESGNGDFTLAVPIYASRTLVRFQSTDAEGKTKTQTVAISYKDKLEEKVQFPWYATRPSLSLGLSLFNYSDSFQRNGLSRNISQILLALKATYVLQGKIWDVGASIYYTPLTLSPNSYGVSAQVLSMGLKGGYSLPQLKPPWRLNVSLGLMFTTMIVADNSFGYGGSMGPQVGVTLQRLLESRDVLFGYLKFTSLPAGSTLFDFTNREVVTGFGWLRPLSTTGTRVMSLQFELTDLYGVLPIVYQGINDIESIHSANFTLLGSYGF